MIVSLNELFEVKKEFENKDKMKEILNKHDAVVESINVNLYEEKFRLKFKKEMAIVKYEEILEKWEVINGKEENEEWEILDLNINKIFKDGVKEKIEEAYINKDEELLNMFLKLIFVKLEIINFVLEYKNI